MGKIGDNIASCHHNPFPQGQNKVITSTILILASSCFLAPLTSLQLPFTDVSYFNCVPTLQGPNRAGTKLPWRKLGLRAIREQYIFCFWELQTSSATWQHVGHCLSHLQSQARAKAHKLFTVSKKWTMKSFLAIFLRLVVITYQTTFICQVKGVKSVSKRFLLAIIWFSASVWET